MIFFAMRYLICFISKYDNHVDVRYGWLEAKGDIDITAIKSDERFGSK